MSFISAAIGIGATLYGGYQQGKAAESAASAQAGANEAAIAEQRAAREAYEQLSQPFLQTGEQGALALQNFLGLPTVNPEYTALSDQLAELEARKAGLSDLSESGGITGRITGMARQLLGADDLDAQIAGIKSKLEATPQTFAPDPSQSGFATTLEEVNPLVGFLRDQGFEQILESAAAGGRLGAGGTLRDLTEFNTNLASTVVPQLQNQRFNQLFNVAGLGANTAAGVGTAGLSTATNVGNLLGNIGQAQASGIINRSNAITGGLENLAGAFGGFGGSGGLNQLGSSTVINDSAPSFS